MVLFRTWLRGLTVLSVPRNARSRIEKRVDIGRSVNLIRVLRWLLERGWSRFDDYIVFTSQD